MEVEGLQRALTDVAEQIELVWRAIEYRFDNPCANEPFKQ
jgi:hypothetical protein